MAAAELNIANARVVLPDRILEAGWVTAEGGVITGLGDRGRPEGALDFAGDLLIPGLVELHTDTLESHYEPRPGVLWHGPSAVMAYDAELAAAGVTTVFDSLRVGTDERRDIISEKAGELLDTIAAAQTAGNLRAQHFTHLRCEVCSNDVVEATAALMRRAPIGVISLMDHTPGQRQFRDVEKLKAYYRSKLNMTDAQIEVFMQARLDLHARNSVPHRRQLIALAQQYRVPVASHDDATVEQVAEAIADGVSVAEFPTTAEAAAASHNAGIRVLMGAPNVVRGGSHSGNVAAADLARAGTLDILSSDYVPASLLLAVSRLVAEVPGIDLPKAIALVTRNPAHAVGLADRGEIAPGKRADLVRMQLKDGLPVVRAVWRQGERVL